MSVSFALYQPDIAQNTGTMIRLATCLNVSLHIIHPTGFAFSEKILKRSGMDYVDFSSITEHDSFLEFEKWRKVKQKRLILLSTKASDSIYQHQFNDNDILMMGRESAGVPQEVANSADVRVRIPMDKDKRSINVALSAAIVLGEAMRQTGGFDGLI